MGYCSSGGSEREREKAKSFWDLCHAVGMKDPPALLTAFADRYGEYPEDIRPFKLALEPGPEKFLYLQTATGPMLGRFSERSTNLPDPLSPTTCPSL